MNLLRAAKNRARETRLFSLVRSHQRNATYRDWLRAGRPVPPPHAVKERAVREHAERFHLPVFVETGTYRGDMVEAVKQLFEEVYSIELSPDLWQRARDRFAHLKHVSMLQGDSGEVLKELLAKVTRPCLFWLDGHYSAGMTAKGELETPVRAELERIFAHPMARDHVVLIDDARCFTGEGDYPTLDFLRGRSTAAGFGHFEVEDDIIRIHR